MVVNLRGTGGSGKSHIVREVMAHCVAVQPEFVAGRQRPIGYVCQRPSGLLFIPGHYETSCGGCDTITRPDAVYDLVTAHAEQGYDVLYEGIIVQDETRRCVALAARFPLVVLAVSAPMEICLASIQARRDARGDRRPLNPTNTINRQRRLEGIVRRLVEQGIDARWLTRDEALAEALRLLGLGEAESASPAAFELRP